MLFPDSVSVQLVDLVESFQGHLADFVSFAFHVYEQASD